MITWTLQYYSILHAYWVVLNSIIMNITYNITQYYLSNHTILLNVIYIWVVFNTIFFNINWVYQCYSILYAISSNTDFNILLHIR